MLIAVECNPSRQDVSTLSEGIISFNNEHVPDLEPIQEEKRFYVFVRGNDGEVRGGIRAKCYWNTLHIELLWVAKEARSLGLGKKLIDRAESYAMENQCSNAFVETTSWQAKPFYEKNGYKHMGTLNDRPKGHASYYLIKALASD